MYQPNLQHVLAKSTKPPTVQDYNAALADAGGFLAEIEKAHANPLSGDPLAKSTFSGLTSHTSGLTNARIEWVGERYRYRTHIGQSAQTVQGQMTAAYRLKDMPDFVRASLDPYRSVVRI
jgi:hypothetical protein